jgi:death-on-curing family protein
MVRRIIVRPWARQDVSRTMPTHQKPSASKGSAEPKKGEIIIYRDKQKKTTLEVRLEGETVWLSQAQIAQLFGTQRPGITKHLRNIFKSKELDPKSVRSILEHTALDGKAYKTQFYNLDAIISIGYRVNSQRATQFRVWATGVLRDHIIKGVTVNQKRIQELKGKQLDEFREALALLESAKQKALTKDETAGLLEVITDYANAWLLLQKYDEGTLGTDRVHRHVAYALTYADAKNAITELKKELLRKREAGDLFGMERGHGLEAILGNLIQTFGGELLYPSVEEKAAHLLYFVIKDHPFADGNKRIGSFLFIMFLSQNNHLFTKKGERKINDNALVALALLIAESKPSQKEVMAKLIINLLTHPT